MTEYIRLDLTPDEAEALEVTIKMAIMHLAEVPVEALRVRARLVKARANPLNGPTFDWATK